jgi:hypothetical protein
MIPWLNALSAMPRRAAFQFPNWSKPILTCCPDGVALRPRRRFSAPCAERSREQIRRITGGIWPGNIGDEIPPGYQRNPRHPTGPKASCGGECAGLDSYRKRESERIPSGTRRYHDSLPRPPRARRSHSTSYRGCHPPGTGRGQGGCRSHSQGSGAWLGRFRGRGYSRRSRSSTLPSHRDPRSEGVSGLTGPSRDTGGRGVFGGTSLAPSLNSSTSSHPGSGAP